MQGKDFQRKQEFRKRLTTFISILDIGEGERVWGVVRGTSNWWFTSRERNWCERERHIITSYRHRPNVVHSLSWSLTLDWFCIMTTILIIACSIIIFDAYQRQTDRQNTLCTYQTPMLRRTPLDTETHIFIRRVTMTETTFDWNMDTLMVWWRLTPTPWMVSPTL